MSIIIMQIIVADQWISNLLCADAVDRPDDDQVGGEDVPGQGEDESWGAVHSRLHWILDCFGVLISDIGDL